MTSDTSLSMILPIYNERRFVREAVERCLHALDADFDDFELILVDDGSHDGTGQEIDNLAAEHERVVALHNHVNLNVGISIQRAFGIAQKALVLHNAVDLPLAPESVMALIRRAGTFDVLVLERQSYPAATVWRKTTSVVNRALRQLCFPTSTGGIRDMNFTQIYRREILPTVMPVAKSPAFTTPEMILRAILAGLEVKSLTVEYQPRPGGGPGAFGRVHDIAWTMYDMLRFRLLAPTRSRGRG